MILYAETAWQDRIAAAALYRYAFAPAGFQPLNDAGMHVSHGAVEPVSVVKIPNLIAALARAKVDLRFVDHLGPLHSLRSSSLHVSAIRLRNAAD